MASSREVYCGICEGRNKYTKAVQYCPECEDALCNRCLEHHSISKATKTHHLIPAEDYKNLPSFILDIKTFCDEHNEKYQNYCTYHQDPLCKKCIATTHKDCKGISILDDVIYNAKSSTGFEDIETTLAETTRNIQNISTDKENNLEILKQQRQNIKEEIEKDFIELSNHFDELKKDTLSRLTDEADKHEKCQEKNCHELKEHELKIDHLRDSICKMKLYASDLQAFLGIRMVQELVKQEEDYVHDVLSRGGLNHVTLLYSRDNDIKDIMGKLSTFGQISAEEKPSQVVIEKSSDRRAQTVKSKVSLEGTTDKEYDRDTWVYKARFSFHATDADELTFREGDIIQILDKSNHDWWCGRKIDFKNETDFNGLVPSNYLQKENPLFFYEWYIGKASDEKKEKLLLNVQNVIGSFLIAEGYSIDDTYELSVLFLNKSEQVPGVRHYKMERIDSGFRIYDENTSITIGKRILPDVVQILSREDCGLCQRLTIPCKQEMEDWEVTEESVDLDEKLHDGGFSCVWKGRWNKAVSVAICAFKSDTDSIKCFSSEVNTLKTCRHDHIIKMYGVCSTSSYIVTELLLKENLLGMLRSADSSFVEFKNLVRTAAQIADGMACLELKSIIHTDLKARNILMTANHQAKICGFQHSLTLETDAYNVTIEDKFPVKWTALEVFRDRKFSVKSDVWSYGVLLVELFNLGKQPYGGIRNEDLMKKLQSGYRHPKPDMCPVSMYNIMDKCWNNDPASRPTFEFLFNFMDDYKPHYHEIPPS